MKNDCGHELQHEESRLVCGVCEAEEQQRAQDRVWNAAIEAAAVHLEKRAKNIWSGPSITAATMRGVYDEETRQIRALKREAK